MRTRVLAVLVFIAAASLGFVSSASAHVEIEPDTAAPDTVVRFSFVVPNERPTEATVKLTMQLPPDHPLPFVSVRPTPGWTVTVTKQPLDEATQVEGHSASDAVSTITWEGGRIEPDQYEVFEVDMGPLPTGVDVLYFPAIQTYANGEEVAWIERPSASVPEPPLPAPALSLTGTAPSADAAAESAAPAATDSDGDDSSNALAGLALGVGIVALVVGVIAIGRTFGRKPPTRSSTSSRRAAGYSGEAK